MPLQQQCPKCKTAMDTDECAQCRYDDAMTHEQLRRHIIAAGKIMPAGVIDREMVEELQKPGWDDEVR